VSPMTGRRYPVALICAVWRVPRSTVYAQRRDRARGGARGPMDETGLIRDALSGPENDDRHRGRDGRTLPPRRKRGPKTPLDDATLTAEIRAVLEASPFCTEGHRKVRARLRAQGIRVGKERVRRLMREANLLAPTRRRHAHGDRAHAGTIITSRPDELWGTDATKFWTRQEGWCWFFGAIDHCAEDIVGWHVAKVGDRWAALEPIRQAVQQTHGGYAPKIALGLGLRMDWGPQYTADQFLGELRWLGIRPSPSYVGEPECNGIMERWIRTLKEECLYLYDFESVEQARQVIGAFIARYNREWLLERHGHRTPTDVRRALTRQAA
jgi:putative transposase